jgi:predicted chitinase
LNYAAPTRNPFGRSFSMGPSIREYWRKRRDIFGYFRDVKWMIAISLLLLYILSTPDQIRELYRLFIADITFVRFITKDIESVAIDVITFVVPLVAIALIVLIGTYQVTSESIETNQSSSQVTTVAQILPPFCGSLPLFASALGQFSARPDLSSIDSLYELPAGPWDDFRKGLHIIATGLTISGCLFVLLGVIVFAIGFKLTDKMRPRSTRLNDVYFMKEWFLAITVILVVSISLVFIISPVYFPQMIGSFGILALFTLCLVAFCVHLSLLTIKWHFPVIPTLLLIVFAFAFFDLNDDHRVRSLTDETKSGAIQPLAADEFEKWYENRLPALASYDDYPVYIVASEGGGIYAAYQTAIFLARLYDYCPAFNEHLFAISSVSGGSLGAAAYAAALNAVESYPTPKQPATSQLDVPNDPCPKVTEYLSGEKPIPTGLQEPGPMEARVRKIFGSDLLSPLLSATLFSDFTQAFIPVAINPLDRARSLEFAFENSELAMGDQNASYLKRDLRSLWSPDGRMPALVINTTDAGSGRRVLLSPFALDNASGSIGAVIEYGDLGRGQDLAKHRNPPIISLSTAALMSARFPWVTPAATIAIADRRLGPQDKIRLVDGGYVDNSGVETSLDLIESIKQTANEINKKADMNLMIWPNGTRYRKVTLKLIVLSGGGYPIRSSFSFGEALEPMRALLATRQSRGYVAIDRAKEQYPAADLVSIKAGNVNTTVKASDLRIASLNSRYYPLPLGWRMSNRTRRIIEKQSGYFWSCYPDNNFLQSQEALSQTDCIQLLIYHELHHSLKGAATEIALVNQLRGSERPMSATHKRIITCYRDAQVPLMTLPQSEALDTLLDVWDSHPVWSNDRLLAFILGTIANETGNFRVRKEKLDFQTPEQIQSLWKTRFPAVADAVPYVNRPMELAQRVYGNRFGNIKEGDAWLYRGRGMPLLEGRYEYSRYGKEINVDLLSDPDLVMNPVVGAVAAFKAYFPKEVVAKLSSHINDKTEDWTGAEKSLIRVAHKQGIVEKSMVFYDCIKKAKLSDTTSFDEIQ